MKNKIALVCNTYVRNYGSILQSYALYKKVKQLGYNVDVINYKDVPKGFLIQIKQTIYIRIPMLFKIKEIRKKIVSIKMSRNIAFQKIKEQRNRMMDIFVKNNFSFTPHCNSVEDVQNVIKKYDCVLIGSDQLWGVAEIMRDYHTLNFVPDDMPKIAYGTSFGVSNLPYFIQHKAKRFLQRIDRISVREKSGAKIINEISGRTAQVVVDPTLLLTTNEWSTIAGAERKIKDSYIFCFFLGNNPRQRDLAKQFSNKVHLPIVSMQHLDEFIPTDVHFADININDASPNDFINLIKNAEYILCDSFHASVFSIIFKKNFFTLDRYKASSSNSRNTRIQSLFSILGIEERHIDTNTSIDNLLKISTNYELVHNKWYEWRNKSLNYLTDSLRNYKHD